MWWLTSIIPVPRDLIPCYDFCGQQANMWYTYVQAKHSNTQLRHLAIVDRVSELAIYCNPIGDYPNCHYRAFTQELIKADTEIHSQALVWTLGVLLKKGRKDCMEPGEIKVMTEEPTETADLSLWEHMDSGPTVREPARDWPRSSACVWQCVVWSVFVRFLAVRSGLILALSWLLETCSPYRLPCLAFIEGEELI